MKTCAAIIMLAAGAHLALAAGEPICFEAESATNVIAPMQVSGIAQAASAEDAATIRQASGEQCLDVPQGKGNPPEVTTGRADCVFDVPEDGEYILWCRAWWSDSCGNSITMVIDDGTPFSFGQDSTFATWHWVKSMPRLPQLKLTRGRHRLRIENREDGVKLDQILFTRDRRYVPIGIETTTVHE